jgi:hypothetical protein
MSPIVLKTGWSVSCAAAVVLCLASCGTAVPTTAPTSPTNLHRATVFLAAGDFRRAVEACRQEVQDHPSARSYLYLTYVYQALDAYVESLARADQWVAMEHLSLNLSSGGVEELLDPPNVLARMAKGMIQAAARQQADVTSELATRLDPSVVREVWPQQTAWRKAKPEGWWFTVPPEWAW